MNKLLLHTQLCPDCGDTGPAVDKPMKIKGSHALMIIKHINDSVNMLHAEGIEHNDVSLSNLVLQPTEGELKSGLLTSSFPILVDFGLSKIHNMSLESSKTSVVMHDLFNTCRHGMRRLYQRSLGVEV